MKTKIDFVTNSSSSCYICLIPEKFTITKDKILEVLKKNNNDLGSDYEEDEFIEIKEDIDNTTDIIQDFINQLKNQQEIDSDVNECVYTDLLFDILDKNHFFIGEVHMARDSLSIQGIKIDNIIDILLKDNEIKINEN